MTRATMRLPTGGGGSAASARTRDMRARVRVCGGGGFTRVCLGAWPIAVRGVKSRAIGVHCGQTSGRRFYSFSVQ